MPLGRFGVRNEYELGGKELYKDAVEFEDPKAVLDGVAVAGLVGLLRQLGDLSLFAAEVFHGLQEQLASTGSRSRKLVSRVQHVEASLPSLEKAMLSQTSHIHFAYTPGSEWHPRIKNEQNHFVCSDLPHFIMDSYEECHEPPRLQLLDRFDTSGPGSCLKRYTDPTLFRRASASSKSRNREKSQQERKARKIKRRSRQGSGCLPNSVPDMNNCGSMPNSSQTGRGESSIGSTFDRAFRSDLGDQSDSFNSKASLSFVASLSHQNISMQPHETKTKECVSNMDENMVETSQKYHLNDQIAANGQDIKAGSSTKDTAPRPSNVTWDEKLEIMEHMGLNNGIADNVQLAPETNYYLHEQELKPVSVESIHQVEDLSEHESITKRDTNQQYIGATMNVKVKEPTGLHDLYKQDVKLVDGNNSQGDDLSELSSNAESNMRSFSQEEGLSEHESRAESTANGKHPTTILDLDMKLTGKDSGIDEVQDLDESTFDLNEHDLVQVNSELSPHLPSFFEVENAPHEQSLVIATSESSPQVMTFYTGENSLKLIANGNFVSDPLDNKLSIGDIQYMLETTNNNNRAIQTVDVNDVVVSLPPVANLPKGEDTPGSIADDDFVRDQFNNNLGLGDFQYMLETTLDNTKLEAGIMGDEYDGPVDTFTEGVKDGNVIEWHYHNDIDRETDNFVDALYTIDSESESDFETYTKKEVKLSTSTCKPDENAATDLMADKINHSGTKHECHPRSDDLEDGVCDVSEKPSSPVSLDNLECLGIVVSSKQSEAATGLEQDALPRSSHEQSMQSSSSFSNETWGTDVCANAPEIKLQPDVHKLVECSSQASHHDKTACTPHVSGEMSFGSTSSYPPAFWTNGTLFGLQPSKPTVFSNSNSVNTAPMSSGNGDIVDQCSPRVDAPAGTMSSSVKNYDHGNNLSSDHQDVGSLKQNSHAVLGKRNNKSLESNMKDSSVTRGLHNGQVTTHKSKVLDGCDLKNVFSEVTNTGEDRSSLLSLLGCNLLKNGLPRSGSLGYEDKSQPSNIFDNACDAAVSDLVVQTNLNGKYESPVNSPPPSPPLEHMKISFQPIDGFGTSRLQLKYPEMTVETFPSFQLVPDSTRLQHNMGSDSDDDTFCLSYPCISDDSVSHRSDSDSEQWETGDTTESNDHEFYDGFHRISSAESVSTSSQHDETDRGSIYVGSISQLPILDTENKFRYAEKEVCINPEADSSRLMDLMAQPPHLPPLQWDISKPLLLVVEDKLEQGSNSPKQSFVSRLLESAISHSVVDDSAKLQSRMRESDTTVKQEKVAEPKVDGQSQNYHGANGRAVDDQGDFLHQIRTKSFNLKRTDAAPSFSTSSLATSNKVTAILQKANAIRQVVGSDGEDDNWSDT